MLVFVYKIFGSQKYKGVKQLTVVIQLSLERQDGRRDVPYLKA